MDKLDNELRELKLKKSELESSLQFDVTDISVNKDIHSLILQAPLKNLSKSILTEFVHQIDVDKEGKAHVSFNIPLLEYHLPT